MDKVKEKGSSAQIVTGIALGAIFLYALSNSMMSALVNEVVKGFSLSGASQGMMSSVFSLGSMLALLMAPMIQGRISKMTVVLSAGALQAVTLVLCGAAPLFPLFCASCAILGVGGGLVDAYCNALVVDVRKEKSPRYLGYLHGLFGVGSLLTPLLVLQLLGMTTWRGVFFVMSGLVAVGIIVLFIFRQKVRGSQSEQATQENLLRWQDVKEYVHTPRNAAVLLLAVFGTATQTGALVWAVRYMVLRFNAEALGFTALSLYWVCATINRFTVAHLKISPIRAVALGGGLAALCMCIGVFSGNALVMCVALGCFGLCTGHFVQVLYSEATKEYEGKTTFATAVLSVTLGIARSLIPLAMAYVGSVLPVAVSMLLPAATAVGVALTALLVERLSTPSRLKGVSQI